jgi:SAM-dependent methyltransferase
MKDIVRRIPLFGELVKRVHSTLVAKVRTFPGSAVYWERRYSAGGNSGLGSYAALAQFKADMLNDFVATHHVQAVIDFGCGDGNQLTLANYPSYIGFDVSPTAIARCRQLFKSDVSKSFRLMKEFDGDSAELVLSLDVIYHLVEDDAFENYVRTIFAASKKHVIIYATDFDDSRGYDGMHIKHRKFTKWIRDNLPDWNLVERVPNRRAYRWYYSRGSRSEFFVYTRLDRPPSPVPRGRG